MAPVRRRIVPPASAFTPAAFLGTVGDGSPQADLDRLATGTTRTSLRTDAFATATAPVAEITVAERMAASALGLEGDDGMGALGSWLSELTHGRLPAAATSLVSAIPVVGPSLAAAFSAFQSQGGTQQALTQVSQQYQLTAAEQAALLAASAQQQKPDYTKLALIGGGGLLALLVLSKAMK